MHKQDKKPKRLNEHRFTFRVPGDVWEFLEAYAEERHISVTSAIMLIFYEWKALTRRKS